MWKKKKAFTEETKGNKQIYEESHMTLYIYIINFGSLSSIEGSQQNSLNYRLISSDSGKNIRKKILKNNASHLE